MASVPRSRAEGQAPARTFDVTNPRAVFVWITEAREAFDDLVSVAADATRAPGRRKLSRGSARARYKRACAALAWLYSMPLAPAPEAAPSTPPVPADVIAASWKGWEA
jgi:hypothetical protein